MEFLGIGPLELLIVLLLALVLLGPKDMAKAGRSLGKFMRRVVTSPQWKVINQTSQELRNLPNRLIREAGLEEMQQDINNLQQTTAEIQDTLRTSSILPPNWMNPTTTKTTSVNIEAIRQEPGMAAGSGEADDEFSNNLIQPDGQTASLAAQDLSAWTGPAKPEANQDLKSTDDLSAWITPPPAGKSSTP